MCHLRPTAFAVVLLMAFPLWAGCDSGATNGHVTADLGVQVSTFTVSGNQFQTNQRRNIATHVRETNLLNAGVVNNGVVLLYADGSLIFDDGGDTWAPLPYTQGVEAVGDDGVPFVDFTVTYTYSYGINLLYIDFITSGDELVQDFVPASTRFKLVTIPAGTARMEGVDYSSYEAVQRAYGLAD